MPDYVGCQFPGKEGLSSYEPYPIIKSKSNSNARHLGLPIEEAYCMLLVLKMLILCSSTLNRLKQPLLVVNPAL